jgi:predicted nucleic acid-binding protein
VKTLYFDSSYLFRLYFTEAGSEDVQRLAGTAQRIASAWHGRAELATTLLRKRREAALGDHAVQEIRHQIRDDREHGLVLFLDHSEAITARLERVLERAPKTTFIRAADALHLACAAEHGYGQVYSNDRHFLGAAPLFGLEGVDVIET